MPEHPIAARFAVSAALHIAAGTALYAWQVRGIEQAGNLFVFWMWFVAVIFSLSFFAAIKPPKKRFRQSRLLTFLNLPMWLFFTASLAWAGYTVLPVVMVFGLFCDWALRSKYDADGNLKAEEPAHA